MAGRRELLDERGPPAAIGFYNTGQLFLEEYYTLAVIGKAGIGTHAHGRQHPAVHRHRGRGAQGDLRHATASPAPTPTSTTADAIALFGHNVAETQTVLWMRMLDRLARRRTRRAIVVRRPAAHPGGRARPTSIWRRGSGTNVAVMNGLLHEIIAQRPGRPRVRRRAHAWVSSELRSIVAEYPPDRVAEICGRPGATSAAAAAILGRRERLLSTVLQGFYQSHQATAAAVQVNNLHLIRGMLGRPGCGILQMNGQPTAQNTREMRRRRRHAGLPQLGQPEPTSPSSPGSGTSTRAHPALGAADARDADLPLRRAGLDPVAVGHRHEPGRVAAELAPDPQDPGPGGPVPRRAGHLPDRDRPSSPTWSCRRRSGARRPARFTNADRTVHLSDKAVEPPGEARSDLDIFLDYARRMDFRDKDGAPLIKWHDPEGAFDAWKACSRRPALRLHRPELRRSCAARSGIQWPCNADAPDGTERLYADGTFCTRPGLLRDYGHDLVTGALRSPERVPGTQPRRPGHPQGRRVPAPARGARPTIPALPDHRPGRLPLPHPHQDRPGPAAAGGRARPLGRAPCGGRGRSASRRDSRSWSSRSADPSPARRGSTVIRRGSVRAVPLRAGGGQRAHHRPLGPGFQAAAVQGRHGAGPRESGYLRGGSGAPGHVCPPSRTGVDHPRQSYSVARRGPRRRAGGRRAGEALPSQCEEHTARLGPARDRYGDHPAPDRLHVAGLTQPRTGGLGLLRDLHEVYDYASHLDIAWTLVAKAAQGNRDPELQDVATSCGGQVAGQLAWLTTQIGTASAQVLLVAD